MSVLNTVLIYVVVPLFIIVVIAGLSRAGSDSRRTSKRYRPGRSYDFAPIWFLGSPEQVTTAIAAGPERRPAQIEGGIIEGSTGSPVRPGPVGGASDRW